MRKYTLFIDENLPPQIARGLDILLQPQAARDGIEMNVFSIKDKFGQGAKDEDWIPLVGKMNGIVLTQDFRIQSLKHQRELYKLHGVGIFFFSPPSKSGFSYWDMVKLMVNRYESIRTIIKRNKPPFAYRCSAKKDFENVDQHIF